MSRQIDSKLWRFGLLATAFTVIGALPAFAHCGKCAVDGQAMAKAIKSGKVGLSAATTLAEAATKGVAVRATAHMHDNKCFIEVHCMVNDKIMAVDIDCATGKPGEPAEVKNLDSHAGVTEDAKADAAGEAPSDADVQSQLDEITQATKAGKLDEAESSLSKLEEMKNLSESLKSKVEAARQALDTAKAASDLKSKLPDMP